MNESTRKKGGQNGKTLLRQRGIVVPIVVIGLLAILAVAGLALDGSHALANKTRIQNTVDAAALAAAKVLDDTDGDTVLATAGANSLFSINAGSAGNHELSAAFDAGDINLTVQYSSTLDPFVPGSFVPGSTSWFVRVIATGFDTRTSLSSVLGIAEIPTPATAVAGPSGPLGNGEGAYLCDIAPIAVCASDAAPDDADQGKLRVLKPNPGTHGDVGPGNYKMLRMYNPDDDTICSGGDCLRENLAGAYDICLVVGEDVETEPGVSSGPVSQGFNTRFNQYQGAGLNAGDYPPDQYIGEQDIDTDNRELKACEDPANPLNEYVFLTDAAGPNYCRDFGENAGFDPYEPSTWEGNQFGSDWTADHVPDASEIDYNYDRYSADPTAFPGPAHPDDPSSGYEYGRRLLKFPLIDCSGDQNGQSSLPYDGFACFFMVQSLEGGQADGAGNIFGQFINTCPANGTGGIEPGGGPPNQLLYKIQLYKNPDSADS